MQINKENQDVVVGRRGSKANMYLKWQRLENAEKFSTWEAK